MTVIDHKSPRVLPAGLLALLLGCLVLGSPGVAVSDTPVPSRQLEVTAINLGFDGAFRIGAWTQGSVEIQSPAEGTLSLIIEAPDTDENVVRFASSPVQLSPAGKGVLTTTFKTGRFQGELLFRIEQEGHTLWQKRIRPSGSMEEKSERPAPLPYAHKLWVSLGSPGGLKDQPIGTCTSGGVELPRTLQILNSASHLPDSWQGYEGVDVFFLLANAVDTQGKPLWTAMSPRQVQALEQWVAHGGQLLMSVGRNSQRLASSPLGAWLPLKLEGEYQLRSFSALQSFGGKPIRGDQNVPSTLIRVDPRQIVVPGVNGPIAADVPYKLGYITFVTLDLDQTPFNNWDGIITFYDRLLTRGRDRQAATVAKTVNTRLSQSGISEIASQWFQAISHFPGIHRVSIWGNLALVLGYLLIVGPVDYFLVQRLLKRPEWTWVTLPLWIILGATLGFQLARSGNGSALLGNQATIVDVDQTSGTFRGRAWVSLYSPATRRYSLVPHASELTTPASPTAPSSTLHSSWWSPPENVIGGLYRKGALQLGIRSYLSDLSHGQLQNVPMQLWSTKCFESEWTGTAKPFVRSALQSSGSGNLAGTVTWELNQPLRDCCLVYGNRIYFPAFAGGASKERVLPTGIPWDPTLSSQTSQRELRGYLTKMQTKEVQRVYGETDSSISTELQNVTAPYDVESIDRKDILTILTFHEYAGGTDYTGLGNQMLSSMDWSQHLRMGRAVLFGRVRKASLKLEIPDSQPQFSADDAEFTYVRSLLPVARLQGKDQPTFESPKQLLLRQQEELEKAKKKQP